METSSIFPRRPLYAVPVVCACVVVFSLAPHAFARLRHMEQLTFLHA